MDISQLRRNAPAVHADLVTLDDKSIVTRGGCKIYIPMRYAERDLATVSNNVRIIGIFCIVLPTGEYGVSTAMAQMDITPVSTNQVTVDGVDYYEFEFEPGGTVIAYRSLVMNDNLPYRVYNEFVATGNIPWYFSYEDVGKLFVSSQHHAGVRLAANHQVLEMIAAAISRSEENRRQHFRLSIDKRSDLTKKTPAFIALRAISLTADTTTARLMGSYFDDGLDSALTHPSEKSDDIEKLLRL